MEEKFNEFNKKSEFVGLKGSLVATLYKADGTIEVTRKDNMILNVGFDFIANAIGRTSSRPNPMSYIAVGTGNNSVNVEQSALTTEIGRKSASFHHISGSKVFSFGATFGTGEAVGAISEAGVCNEQSNGVFLDRVTFAEINKTADDVVTFNFHFTLS